MATAPQLSKADYLKRYLSEADVCVDAVSSRKWHNKCPKPGGTGGKGMRIVDMSWTVNTTIELEKGEEEDGDLPVVAEFVDERSEEVKQMEAFRSSAKWKLLGGHSEDLPSHRHFHHDAQNLSPPRRVPRDTPDLSPPRRGHQASDASQKYSNIGVSPRRVHRGSLDISYPRKAHHHSDTAQHRRILDSSEPQHLKKVHHDSSGSALARIKIIKAPERSSGKTSHEEELRLSHPPFSKTTKHERDSDLSSCKWQARPHVGAKKQLDSQGVYQKTDSELSLQKSNPEHQDSDSDLLPPRNKQRHRNSDLSPSQWRKRTRSSDSDLSPPRRSSPPRKKAVHMYSGARTGLETEIQQEQQELMAFGAQFQFAETVFRDRTGRKRNLKLELLEQRRKAEKDSKREELYAQWGKGLVQSQQQQQNVKDVIKEMQKPLARYINDEDLDQMLREQEREGDPMADFIKKSKAKESKKKKMRPRYNGRAPPPNRFNIWPGYRWDGVDRSNGFEQKRFARLASKKAVEELAYKWSVEDM